MTYLPDVNVWIAMASDLHVHHVSAKQWWDGIRNQQIAFCRMSELGFLRLLTNRHVMQNEVLNPAQAWRAYDNFRFDSRVVFLSETVGFSEQWRRAESEISAGPNAWTDAYLAVFARHVNATVVTFDRGFKSITECKVFVLPSL